MNKIVSYIAALSAISLPHTYADDLEWLGGADPSWSLSSNWVPAQIPAPDDNLTFVTQGSTNAAGITTSIMNLTNPTPFNIGTLVLNPDSNSFHRIDLDGGALKLTRHLRIGYNNGGQRSDIEISGGNFVMGDTTNRALNAAIGYLNASGGASSDGRAVFDVFNFDLIVDTLDIGRRFGGGNFAVTGELDLTASDNVLIDANRVYLGTGTDNGTPPVFGLLNLPTNGTTQIITPQMWLGNSNPAGNQSATSVVTLGNDSTLQVDDLRIGGFKSNGDMRFPAGTTGNTLNLNGIGGAPANVSLGFNNVGTGTSAKGVLDTRGGTINADIDRFILGYHGSSSGNGQGTFIMDAGTITAGQIDLALTDQAGTSSADANTTAFIQQFGGIINVTNQVTDGNGTSQIFVEGGNMIVANDFATDRVVIGRNGGVGLLVAGGPVRIGSGSQNSEIGRRDSGNSLTTGIADFSDAPRVDIDVNQLRIGSISQGGNNGTTGQLLLSETGTNTLTMNTFTVGDSTQAGNTSAESLVRFGGSDNFINANFIHIGRRKSITRFDMMPGGHLQIAGQTGGAANFRIGLNDVNTGTNNEGRFITTNGTLNAIFDDLLIAQHNNGTGSAKGTFHMGAGTVKANQVRLANSSAAGTSANPQNTQATIIIDGGNFESAGQVMDLGGQSTIEVHGGSFAAHGDVGVDFVSVNSQTNLPATFEINEMGAGNSWSINTLEVSSNAIVRLNYGSERPILGTDEVTFGDGAILEIGLTISTNEVSTDPTAASTWIAGIDEWDSNPAKWDAGLPSGVLITNGTSFRAINTTNNLSNGGLTSGTPGWEILVAPGTGGSVDITRNGPDITGGQIIALLDDPSAIITRTTGLIIGDTPGSDAHASQLIIDGSTLNITGGITNDGGSAKITIDHGKLTVTNGGFIAHDFRLGFGAATGIIEVAGGIVELGDPSNPQIIDIARREGNLGVNNTVLGVADFIQSSGVTADASILRVGSANSSNGAAFDGQLLLSGTGTNTLTADQFIIADSPLEGRGSAPNGPTNLVHFGAGINEVITDRFDIGYRKAIGYATIEPGGTLDIRGKNTSATDLNIGFNDTGGRTGTRSDGRLDLTGATFNADLGFLRIGRHNGGDGAGTGALIMEQGIVTVSNPVELANVSVISNSSNPTNTTALLELRGGTFNASSVIRDQGGISTIVISGASVSAPSITNIDNMELSAGALSVDDLLGTISLTMTGGRLTVENMDSDLIMSGGILAPGNVPGVTTISANHRVDNATWEIGVAGESNSLINVTGVLELNAGSTLDLSGLDTATSNSVVIANYGTLNGTFDVINGLEPGWEVAYEYNGNKEIALVKMDGNDITTRIEMIGSDFQIGWDSFTGETYTVERSPSLTPPNWNTITNGVPATPPENIILDQTPMGNRQYYRITLE